MTSLETTSPPQVAVFGCGYWGKNLVRNHYELGSLRMVCDSDPDNLAAMERQYPGVRYERDPLRALDDPEVAGVVIATPAETHFRLALSALQAGKHVFLGKASGAPGGAG